MKAGSYKLDRQELPTITALHDALYRSGQSTKGNVCLKYRISTNDLTTVPLISSAVLQVFGVDKIDRTFSGDISTLGRSLCSECTAAVVSQESSAAPRVEYEVFEFATNISHMMYDGKDRTRGGPAARETDEYESLK